MNWRSKDAEDRRKYEQRQTPFKVAVQNSGERLPDFKVNLLLLQKKASLGLKCVRNRVILQVARELCIKL